MILILDIETTGIPKSRYLDYTYLENFDNARMVQISCMICNDNLEQIDIYDYIIKASDFVIENENFHGITNEISLEKGIDFTLFAKKFETLLENITHIISHNFNFDSNILKSELYRYGFIDIIKQLNSIKYTCSMLKTQKLLNIKTNYGLKYPSLAELYKYTFDKDIENAHNAKYDVINLHSALKYLYDNNQFKYAT